MGLADDWSTTMEVLSKLLQRDALSLFNKNCYGGTALWKKCKSNFEWGVSENITNKKWSPIVNEVFCLVGASFCCGIDQKFISCKSEIDELIWNGVLLNFSKNYYNKYHSSLAHIWGEGTFEISENLLFNKGVKTFTLTEINDANSDYMTIWTKHKKKWKSVNDKNFHKAVATKLIDRLWGSKKSSLIPTFAKIIEEGINQSQIDISSD